MLIDKSKLPESTKLSDENYLNFIPIEKVTTIKTLSEYVYI
jgi:hypothetical protein